MDDVRAVMDAVGSERALILGISEGGPMAALFAATYPRRTAGLVLMGSYARRLWAPDYTIGRRAEDIWSSNLAPEDWGLPAARRFVDERAPSLAGDEDAYEWYASYLVRGASPGAVAQLARMNAEIDVRHVLPSIHVPTLVLYREREYLREAARYMGERIPAARIIELPGADHLPWVEPGRQARQRRRELPHVQPDSPVRLPFRDLFHVARSVGARHPNPGADDLGRPDLELRSLDPRQHGIPLEAGPSGDVEDLLGDLLGKHAERLFAGEGDRLQFRIFLNVGQCPPPWLIVDRLRSTLLDHDGAVPRS